jgi:hypothetical protein
MKHLLPVFFYCAFVANLHAQDVDTLLTQYSNGGGYVNYRKQINTYDASCKLSSSLFQVWDEASKSGQISG